MTCPVCQRPVAPDQADAPFCSARCRLLDLGHWLGGDYRVPLPPEDDEDGALPIQNPTED